jgi:hypothetical protein
MIAVFRLVTSKCWQLLGIASIVLFWSAGVACSVETAATQGVLIIDDSDPDSPFSRELRAQIHTSLDAGVTSG